jgi:hypothetical protein
MFGIDKSKECIFVIVWKYYKKYNKGRNREVNGGQGVS